MAQPPIPVAVFGASGLTGGELVRLLVSHPRYELVYLGANESAGKTLGEVHPHLEASPAGGRELGPLDPSAVVGIAAFAALALPRGASARLAPALVEAGTRVVDLGGDFRLPASAYPEWYGFEHPAPRWLETAAYGLPELFAAPVRDAALVANPGCFPTAAVLGLAPLVESGLIEPGTVLVDGKTGISGAGRAPSEATTYTACQESVRPYRFPRHQHTPEMERALELATGRSVVVSFVPHLVPSVRGVLTTSYVPLADGATTESLTGCLAAAYALAPFVRVLPPGVMVDTKRTRGTNVLELQAVADPRTGSAIVAGALDNLVKGAAGQAIQNLNLMAGLDETLGLPTAAVYP
jgi:N-acetyl-gamma-glutamyl-phosphate reductase